MIQHIQYLTFKYPSPDEKEIILERGHAMCKTIWFLKPGEAIIYAEDLIVKFFRLQYNPEKGETPEGELQKFLDSLVKEFDINWYWEIYKDKFHFRKATNENIKEGAGGTGRVEARGICAGRT